MEGNHEQGPRGVPRRQHGTFRFAFGSRAMIRVLMIDNYDSFTYNIVQYLQELGADVLVHRNDQITLEQIEEIAPDLLVIFPGPSPPKEAVSSMVSILHASA